MTEKDALDAGKKHLTALDIPYVVWNGCQLAGPRDVVGDRVYLVVGASDTPEEKACAKLLRHLQGALHALPEATTFTPGSFSLRTLGEVYIKQLEGMITFYERDLEELHYLDDRPYSE